MIAIVDDLAGEADEEILADALESLYQPVEYTDTVKAQARSGSVAVFRLECAERLELRRLIDTYNYTTTPAMRTRLSRLLHESQKRALAA